ncbi:tRNA 4-thiouridine(8) synthase ThiI [Patescibacteria group bacterium AH-259-L07]|nr:tRNA 4-thiouridine(8) synthase ThiI [Patescibacteria group bacterium AH-259-L07]
MNYIICHYSEIGLKGKNRRFFEERLIQNIRRTLKPSDVEFVKRISGRILIKLTLKGEKSQKQIQSALKNIFGIAYFSFAVEAEQSIEAMQKTAYELIKDKEFKTFRVLTKRSNKNFPIISPDVNKKVSAYIFKHVSSDKRADLKNPDITIYIEIVEKYAFVYLQKIKGPGGLPVGVGGRALVLLSGGIDSPVASYYAMKRGVKLDFIHFHAYPYTNKASIEKVRKIITVLSKFQFKSILYLISFADIQKQIVAKTPPKLRVVLYRRFMARIAQGIAQRNNILALVSGESLGQVASQTLENISVISNAVDIPILRPLIGQDKQEIVEKAKEIGTYDISILPDQDCCARFVPKHPETKARLKDIQKAEKKLKTKKLIKAALRGTVKESISFK